MGLGDYEIGDWRLVQSLNPIIFQFLVSNLITHQAADFP